MLLSISTAHNICSAALIDDDIVIGRRHETVGRGHAERLVPMIGELPGGGRADVITVDIGPGSYTGIRVGVAAARALGLAWGVAVGGFTGDAAIAAKVFAEQPTLDCVTIFLDARRGRLFVRTHHRGREAGPLDVRSVDGAPADGVCAGAGVALLAVRPAALAIDEPDAAWAALLSPSQRMLAPVPFYVDAAGQWS